MGKHFVKEGLITKITKIILLCHENLELYGSSSSDIVVAGI